MVELNFTETMKELFEIYFKRGIYSELADERSISMSAIAGIFEELYDSAVTDN